MERIRPDRGGFDRADLTHRVIGAFHDVYDALGHGLLESVYERAMLVQLRAIGLRAERQVPVRVHFQAHLVGAFRADLPVEDVLLLELKAARELDPQHVAQVPNYLRASRVAVGLLLNFGPRPQVRRVRGPANDIRRDPPASAGSPWLHAPG